MYQALNASRSRFVPVRHLSYHVREWGTPVAGEPPLVLVHGWMDVAASWQFMVDALRTPRVEIAGARLEGVEIELDDPAIAPQPSP